MTEKIYYLALAISQYEGWQPGNTEVKPNRPASVSYRNHNPGNLRSSPFQIAFRDGFAVFYNDTIGFSALMYDLWVKCSGKSTTGLKSTDTLADLIKVYAPPVENNTSAYLDFIVLKTGIASSTRLFNLTI